MRYRRSGFGLRAKLLLLLLAFAVVPLALSIAIGYTISRSVITDISKNALRELTNQHAIHLATELRRQRLLLRTITGQLPGGEGRESTEELSRLLGQSLPQNGVFDGLRIVSDSGAVVVSVSLRSRPARWPEEIPAADWSMEQARVHGTADQVVAYLIAVPAGERSRRWLEGHVPAEDFARLFSVPQHMAGAIEPAIFEGSGRPLIIGHEHARAGLVEAFAGAGRDTLSVVRADVEGRPSLVATAPIQGSSWYFAAALPLEVALAPLARLRDSALASTAILVLMTVMIGVLAARSVTTPLRELARAARHFGRVGTYRAPRPHGADEVGTLVKSFNRMAADLEKSRAEIERLHEREMERAEQLATVGELASGVAHEVRNPVTGVRGAIELVLRGMPDDDAARPLLEEAERQLVRIEDTATQLLRFARPPELRQVVVNAGDLVERAAHVVEARARNGRVEVEAGNSSEPATVRVDPELMVQVLVNLMLNGIDAMRDGGQLKVDVAGDNDWVRIAVQDSGPGIPPDLRPNVFRPFFTTKHQGTGLGLSISHQIVARHGGSVEITDSPGGGATFAISLPRAEEDKRAE